MDHPIGSSWAARWAMRLCCAAGSALLLASACSDDAPSEHGGDDMDAEVDGDGSAHPDSDGAPAAGRDAESDDAAADDAGDRGDAGGPPTDCSELDCGEGGYCELAEGRPRCICRQGYAGPACEREPCEPLLGDDPPCGENTTCSADDEQPTCACTADFAACGSGVITACTTHIAADAANCGACGFGCAGELGCAQGSCEQAAMQVAAGYEIACAVAPPPAGSIDGALWCWGSVSLLDGVSPTDTPAPIAMTHVANVRDIALATGHGCGLTDRDSFTCWGDNGESQLGESVSGVDSVVRSWAGLRAVAVGGAHSCARDAAGAVRCWGANQQRELGAGSTETRLSWDTTVDVQYPPGVALRGVTDLALGNGYSCALLATSEVLCWGSLELIGNQSPPELILLENGAPLDDVVAIDGGESHACALLRGGEVACWGWYDQGALGVPPSPSLQYAVMVPGLSNVLAVEAAGSFYDPFSCAIREDSTLVCWGSHPAGVGNRTEAQELITGPDDQPLRDVVEISGGDAHVCARQRNGQVSCWGGGARGQLGDGMQSTSTWPRLVSGFP